MNLQKATIAKFKKQLLDYQDYIKGFAYLRYTKKKRKFRIALSKKTYFIRKWKKKKGILYD